MAKRSSLNAEKRLLKEFGERIRKIRMSKGLSIYDLTGDDMPIRSRQHWQLIESGQKNINLTTAFKIAASLKMNLDFIVSGVNLNL